MSKFFTWFIKWFFENLLWENATKTWKNYALGSLVELIILALLQKITTELQWSYVLLIALGITALTMAIVLIGLHLWDRISSRQKKYGKKLDLLRLETFTRTDPASGCINIVGVTVTNNGDSRLNHCSVRIENIQASDPDSIYWIFSDSKLKLNPPREEVFGLNPRDHKNIAIAQLDSISGRMENLGIELLCYSIQNYPALDLEQSYTLTIIGSAEIGVPIQRQYKLCVDGLRQLRLDQMD